MAIVINGSGTVTGLSAGGLPDNTVDNGTMADDAVGVAELSATGTASSSTYLRGDNAWAAAGGNVTGGNFTRNIATVGTLALTGFGFTPTVIHFAYGNAYSGLNVGFGYQWATGSYNSIITSPWTATGNWNVEPANGYPITFYSGSGSSSNRTDGRVTSFDSDGVTITFSTPGGSPSGTMRVIYTAWG